MKLYAKLGLMCGGEDGMGDTIEMYFIQSVKTTSDDEHIFEFMEGKDIILPPYDYCQNDYDPPEYNQQ